MPNVIHILQTGIDSLSPWLQPDGELYDPIFNAPTQYGTSYYAYANAVLGIRLGEDGRIYRSRALRGLQAALAYVLNPHLPPRISSAERETGKTWGINHRDFFWPAILKTYLLLKQAYPSEATALQADLAAVRVERSFAQHPPHNWASVWLSGEWLRFRDGLSPYPPEQFDDWIGAYFQHHILLEQGFYCEPGLPNSYDLFTRYHLADILLNGYDGIWKEQLETLMLTGLKRSLAVQLSDGSLASAYRSSGQTWTLGAQCAFFSMAARFFSSRAPERKFEAEQAASRAFSALHRCQRPGAPFSPVQNLLPPNFRVGYEQYTADGHYSSLALAFLAAALEHGMNPDQPELPEQRRSGVLIEHDPTFRAVAHRAPFSLHLNLAPNPAYDAFGIADLTFGTNRAFQFASSVQATGTERFYNLGLALRSQAGFSELGVIAQMQHDLVEPIQAVTDGVGLTACTRPRGSQQPYRITALLSTDGITIEEAVPGWMGYVTLLIPYLRDDGSGIITQVYVQPGQVIFSHGSEQVSFTFEAEFEQSLNLPHGYENRRGLCGLLRLDFRIPADRIRYQVRIIH